MHHIIARGIERRKIFRDDPDRYDFLNRMGLVFEQTQTACYAWALMPNHFHCQTSGGSAGHAG
ncbi:MAG: transposase [Desulfatitalea sp.]|nr:transposase [Desulfatitalea sp.]